MLRITLCLASVAALACGLRAEEKPPAPKAPPLSPGTAKVEGDNLLCELTTIRYVPEQRTETVVQGGMAITVKRTVYVPVSETQRRLIPIKGLQAYAIGDKGTDPTKRLQPLDSTKLAKMLKTNTRVFFFRGADKVSAEQVKDLKDGNVILVLPREKPASRPLPPEKK